MKFRIISISTLMFGTIVLCSCKKLVEVDGPVTSVSSKNVYKNDATAIGVITSLYVNLSNGSLVYASELSGLSCFAGLSADELDYYLGVTNQTLTAYYQNNLSSVNVGNGFWVTAYQKLYTVNSALEGLESSIGLTPTVKQHLMGEAYFMRAFYYFHLVNLYGDVPLVLSTDYTINALIKKSEKSRVYNQIITDLKEAQNLLSTDYLKGDGINMYLIGSEERVRPNKWAATTLLARAYLFMGEWANAEAAATAVLTSTTQFQLESLDRVFLKNNREAIWQLQPVQNRFNTQEAETFIIPSEGPNGSNPVYLSSELIKDFEPGDQRRVSWVNSVNANSTIYYYPCKYKVKQSSITNAQIGRAHV